MDHIQEVDRHTVTVDEVAVMVGVSRNQAYTILRQEGEIAGVKAIYVGRRIVLPRARLEEALGLKPVG